MCNKCACNWNMISQTILVCNWRSQKVPSGGARIAQNNACQKALCNRCPVQSEYEFPNNKNVCNHFGSHSMSPLCLPLAVGHARIHLKTLELPSTCLTPLGLFGFPSGTSHVLAFAGPAELCLGHWQRDNADRTMAEFGKGGRRCAQVCLHDHGVDCI